MWKWASKTIHEEGLRIGKNIIDLNMQATIRELQYEVKNLKSKNQEKQKQIDELVENISQEFINLAKQQSEEIRNINKKHEEIITENNKKHGDEIKKINKDLIDLKNEWKDEINRAKNERELYSKERSEVGSIATLFNEFLQLKLQAANSAGQRVERIIEKSDERIRKGLKKIEKN